MSWFGKKKESNSEAFDSMYELHTLNNTLCAIPYLHYQRSLADAARSLNNEQAQTTKIFKTGYYFTCLDHNFKKYDLYKNKNAKSLLRQEQECYPEFEKIHKITLAQQMAALQKQKIEENKEDNETLVKFFQESSECHFQKKIAKSVLDEKLKTGMSSKFSESAPRFVFI